MVESGSLDLNFESDCDVNKFEDNFVMTSTMHFHALRMKFDVS